MIRILFLIVIFLVGAVIAAIMFTPLGFVLERSGATKAGAGWAQVEGTLMQGRISGFYFGSQPIGDVTLKLRPASLLSFSPVYDVQWGGAGGNGTGIVKIANESIAVTDVRLVQQVSSIEALAAPVRALGGAIRLRNGAITMSRTGCDYGQGELSTDLLSRAAQRYGREFGQIEGDLSCSDQDVVVSLAGVSERGDEVQVDGRTSFLGAAVFDVLIETRDVEVVFGLLQAGFERRDDALHYHYEEPGRLGL